MSKIPDGINRGPLSKDEVARIVELAERGFVAGRIAQRLNRHPGTISYAMHRLGLRTLCKRRFSYVRAGVAVKSFSDEEDVLLLDLRTQGLSVCRIAALMTDRFAHRRSPHTINVRLVLLSNQDQAA